MSILKHKELIKAWLDGAVVQTRRSIDDNWGRIKQAKDCDDLYFLEHNEYRIKPKTETTWIWVAEWDYHKETCMRSTKNPWTNDKGEYSLVKPLRIYKIEESKQETLIE